MVGTCGGETIARQHDGVSDADGGLLLGADGLNGPCRTHLRAACASHAAIAVGIAHFGLHKGVETGGGAQDMLWAFADAELAACAARGEVLLALCAKRTQRALALWHLLVEQHGQSAIQLLFLCLHGHRGTHGGGGSHKLAATIVDGHLLAGGAHAETYCTEAALAEAVPAVYAARVVHLLVVDVDAHALAPLLALAAAHAFLLVYHDAEQAVAAHQAQQRPHGADGVAPGAPPTKADYAHQHQRNDGHRLWQSSAMQVCNHACKGAVGGNEGGHPAQTKQHQCHKESQHHIAQPVVSLAEAELTLGEKQRVHPDEDVLKDTHRADYRAV